MSALISHLFTPVSSRPIRVILATAGIMALGACASMRDIPAGTPYAEVEARHGRPTVECPLPDGSRSVVWSTQPMGQQAWATRVSPDGRVGPVEQVLSDAAFRRIEIGGWDTDRLRCQFGPPAEITTVGMPSVRQTVWSYRYLQSSAWHSLMHIYVSDDGIVQRMHPGPDPLYEQIEWFF